MRGRSEGSLSREGHDAKRQEGLAEIKAFDWNNRWLKGHEYEFILKNAEAYCVKFGFEKYSKKTHPTSIYERPVSMLGLMQTEPCISCRESALDQSSGFQGSSQKRNSVGKK